MEATTKGRETHWRNWCSYVAPLGVDPTLQDTDFQKGQRLLTGFGGLNRTGYYGRGKQVQGGTVSSAITAVGTAISVACDLNPTKKRGSEKMLSRIQEMLDGFAKEDPPTMKKLPVEVDVPELLGEMRRRDGASELDKAVADSV